MNILNDFFRFKRYNLHQIANAQNDNVKDNTKDKAEDTVTDNVKDNTKDKAEDTVIDNVKDNGEGDSTEGN